jgi:hypothetical protein
MEDTNPEMRPIFDGAIERPSSDETNPPRAASRSLLPKYSISALILDKTDLYNAKAIVSQVRHIRVRRMLGSSGWDTWGKATVCQAVANIAFILGNLYPGIERSPSWRVITPLRC